MYCDILLYCDMRTLAEDEEWRHPSEKVPDFGMEGEPVSDYVVLAEIGDKVVAYCNVPDDQAARIIRHIGENPGLGHKAWSCYDSLLLDADNAAIAYQVFKYPVRVEVEIMGIFQTVSTHLTVRDAQNRGITIDANNILVPNEWAGTN